MNQTARQNVMNSGVNAIIPANPQQKPELTPEQVAQKNIITKITESIPAYRMALGKNMDAERFARIAFTLVRKNPLLAKCTLPSILGAFMSAAEVGLEPNMMGLCFIIPRYEKVKDENGKDIVKTDANGKWLWKDGYPDYVREWQACFQMGWKGYRQLFYNHPLALPLEMHPIYEKDHFEYEYGLDSKIIHKPAPLNVTDKGKVLGYYAIARMRNGGYSFSVMSVAEVIKIAEKYSDSYKAYLKNRDKAIKEGKDPDKVYTSSKWVQDIDPMGLKTVARRALDQMPMSTEKCVIYDNTIRNIEPSSLLTEDSINALLNAPPIVQSIEYDGEDIIDVIDVETPPEVSQDTPNVPPQPAQKATQTTRQTKQASIPTEAQNPPQTA